MSADKTVYVAAKLAKVQIIAAERNSPSMYYQRYNFLQRIIIFSLLNFADRIIVQFPQYSETYPFYLRRKISVIANPVQPSKSRCDTTAFTIDGRFLLLAVSRLDKTQKGLSCLVDAFAKIADSFPEWDLEIIGEGGEKQSLISQINFHSLDERIRILPPVPDIVKKYSNSNLFVIPSLWEGFPNSLAEAMSNGLPAVGFKEADGVRHLIENGVTGWLADGLNDPQNLAEALKASMSNSVERQRRGNAAISAMGKFSKKIQYTKWKQLIMDGKTFE